MLLMPDRAARVIGPPIAARKPPVFWANVRTEVRVTRSAPPTTTTARIAAAPAGASSASTGAPTNAPIHPPASTTSPGASESFSGPKATWSRPSPASDTIVQPTVSWVGLEV